MEIMERRTYPRVEVTHAALYVSPIYPRPKVATTIDLSLGGIKIETIYSLILGEDLEVSVAIDPQVITCRGKVVHASQVTGEKLKAGVRSEGMSKQDALYLGAYVYEQANKSGE